MLYIVIYVLIMLSAIYIGTRFRVTFMNLFNLDSECRHDSEGYEITLAVCSILWPIASVVLSIVYVCLLVKDLAVEHSKKDSVKNNYSVEELEAMLESLKKGDDES